MRIREKSKIIQRILNNIYPKVPIPLKYRNTFTLLVSVLLSAQCTDVNVNNFTKNIYQKYKYNEYQLRNTINFERIIFSNFLELNENTIIDFKKNKKGFSDIFINYFDTKENIIYAESGSILKNENRYIFNRQQSLQFVFLDLNNIDLFPNIVFFLSTGQFMMPTWYIWLVKVSCISAISHLF